MIYDCTVDHQNTDRWIRPSPQYPSQVAGLLESERFALFRDLILQEDRLGRKYTPKRWNVSNSAECNTMRTCTGHVVYIGASATVTANGGDGGNRRGVWRVAQVRRSHAPTRFLFWEHRKRPQLRDPHASEDEILLYWVASPGY